MDGRSVDVVVAPRGFEGCVFVELGWGFASSRATCVCVYKLQGQGLQVLSFALSLPLANLFVPFCFCYHVHRF
jgi:hypothetical protein